MNKVNAVLIKIPGGVTAVKGFRANGLHCGIRKAKKDIALLVSDSPATVAGVFTMNKAVAAPVIIDREQLAASATCSAVVVNSGVANACTGEQGMVDGWSMVRATAEALGIPESEVMISSTGVIGEYLPIDKITTGIAKLATMFSSDQTTTDKTTADKITADGGTAAAEAIMTTDTLSKEYAVRVPIGDATITIGAMAKGSGMIAPNMATMLAFVTSDIAISQPMLQRALSRANAVSFNRISVDGDMSTNDMAIVLANGTAGNPTITEDCPELTQFEKALEHVMVTLARMIARDGEGATKLIEVAVSGGASEEEAVLVARAIANSSLVKTAVHGADANWGRIIAAIGYSGVEFEPDGVTIALNDVPVLLPGYQIVVDEEKATEALKRDEVVIAVDLNRGPFEVRFWTCDLTKDYVHINASYRS
jgi:glutamate N-acetyltransferase/amino-acid N-acetyltransferase